MSSPKVCPVLQIPGRTVNFVDYEAKTGRPRLAAGLPFFEPANDEESLPSSELGDLFPLGEKRDAFALLRGGDPEITEEPTFI
jgi:hypothetical protein